MTLYKKHNSFEGIRSKTAQDQSPVIQRLQKLRTRTELVEKLNSQHRSILRKVFDDIFIQGGKSDSQRFVLTPNVIDEINSYPDEAIPRYLIHRYRYEMFPQLFLLDDYPPYLQIEPSSFCNYRCIFCYNSDKTFTTKSAGFMGYMQFDRFRRIIDEIEGNIEFISLASRGEPLLCPNIDRMLAYTAGKFLNLKLNTNASLLDERISHAILQSGVKTLVFSIDACDDKQYRQLRVGGSLKKVLNNVEQFQRIRTAHYSSSKIITRVSGVKYNDQQDLDAMQEFFDGLVEQVVFVKYNPWENVYEQPENDIKTSCSDLWRRMFIWWDGKANPCDVDYKSMLSVGTTDSQSIHALWHSDAYMTLRKHHLENERSSINPCKRCVVI